MFNSWQVSSLSLLLPCCTISGQADKKASVCSLLASVGSSNYTIWVCTCEFIPAHFLTTIKPQASSPSLIFFFLKPFWDQLGSQPSSPKKAWLCNKPFHTLWVCMQLANEILSGESISLLWANHKRINNIIFIKCTLLERECLVAFYIVLLYSSFLFSFPFFCFRKKI